MATITYKGESWQVTNKAQLAAWEEEHANIFPYIRTRSQELIQLQVELFLDEMDRQDAEGSTGSYGKIKEVMARVDTVIKEGGKIYLHDVRCRPQKQVDQLSHGIKIEHKTSFAQWEYGYNYDDCINKLQEKAAKGYVWNWDPFKDGREIVMDLASLLEYLASYKPEKGLQVWFSFKPAKNQLQIQPVTNSAKRRAWIEALLED